MPPKKGKKGGGKKGAGGSGKKLPKVTEGLHTSEMTKNQLLMIIKRLVAEKDRELMERNLFMLEKSKLFTLWNFAMDHVRLLKDEARNSEVKRDMAEKARDAEREAQEQKLRQLQNEQLKGFGMIRLHHLKYMKSLSDEIWAIENLLRESAVGKRMQIRSQLRAQYEILRGFHMKHGQALSNMLVALSKSIRSKEQQWERLFDSRQDASTAKLTSIDGKVVTKKLCTLDLMDESHELIMQDCQTFYNDMTLSNFGVIESLQQEVDELRDDNRRLARDLVLAKQKYFETTAPLEEMQRNMISWDLADQDPQSLVEIHTECTQLTTIFRKKLKCRDNLEVMIEIMTQQVKMAKEELNKVKGEFIKGLLKLQKQLTMGNMVDQLRTKAARKDTAILEAVGSAKRSGNLASLRSLHNKVDQVHRKVRQRVGVMDRLPSCSLPQAVDIDIREYGVGLRNKEGAILPPINATVYRNFQGVAQDTHTRIQYKGPESENDEDEEGSNETAKPLAYGYFYKPKEKFRGGQLQVQVPPPPELPSESGESTETLPVCGSPKTSEFWRISGRSLEPPPKTSAPIDTRQLFKGPARGRGIKFASSVLYKSIVPSTRPSSRLLTYEVHE